jgi:hypothetical protein
MCAWSNFFSLLLVICSMIVKFPLGKCSIACARCQVLVLLKELDVGSAHFVRCHSFGRSTSLSRLLTSASFSRCTSNVACASFFIIGLRVSSFLFSRCVFYFFSSFLSSFLILFSYIIFFFFPFLFIVVFYIPFSQTIILFFGFLST